MQKKEIMLQFDLDDEVDRRVYEAIMNLPEFYGQEDLSKSLIRFINNLVSGIGECEERREKCENALVALLGSAPRDESTWQ